MVNWRTYIESDNPVAAALLSKMGYTEKEKVQVKKEFLQMLVRMKLDSAKSRFINAFFETYLVLSKNEEEELMEEIKQLDNAEEIMSLPNSWEEKGIKKGIQNVILNMLKKNFSVEVISDATDVSVDEVKKIKEEMGL